MSFKIGPVPPEKELTWRIEIDGQPATPRHITIESDYGRFAFGWRPEGFNGWAFKPGKGGAMTLPFARTPTGDLLIGLVYEHRPNMGASKVWCPLGGFVERGETESAAASREAMEEGGLDTSASHPLEGAPFNNDRLYYVMEEGDDWGMKAYALELPYDMLELVEIGRWRPAPSLIGHQKESDVFFLHWKDAVRVSADMFVSAGIARLLCALL